MLMRAPLVIMNYYDGVRLLQKKSDDFSIFFSDFSFLSISLAVNEMAESSVSVCSVCLSAISPTNQSLLTFVCYKPSHHARAPRVRVKWNAERGMIERMKSQDSPLGMSFTTRSHPSIRPMPREVVLVPGRGFILCDRKRCVGEQCTYAHSKEELDAWNEHLSASLSNRKFSYEEKIGCRLILIYYRFLYLYT